MGSEMEWTICRRGIHERLPVTEQVPRIEDAPRQQRLGEKPKDVPCAAIGTH
ncbi:unannotated protein [freshwater metagenome]|uniref:Unannotated protein n=1 Tax=freshwater metagenome TaxID=449393 RepID=A0A6J6YNJ0_9ZZZZ